MNLCQRASGFPGDEGTILPMAGENSAPITMDTSCKHLQVRVVAREDDIEFVECQLCGEVFDANEFHDMEIEEKVQAEPDED
jgi:Zn ribbon nucleic-acid-binding protein